MAQTASDAFVIEGARPLNGRVRAAGNKNGALPILAACLLTEDEVVLHDVPRILDVLTMIDLLVDLGAEVEWIGPNDVRVRAANVTKTELDEELCKRIRASVLLAGPLARALRQRDRAATRRRRHRPPARRHAHSRVRAARRRDPLEPQVHDDRRRV